MIYSESPRPWIIVMFKRDDNERILLGDGYYQFKDGQQQFAANTYVNDTVDVQGGDGTLLAGQVRRASTQSFDGYVGDRGMTKIDIEKKRREFYAFFRKDHYYDAIYIFEDGTAMKRQRGYIVDAPEVQEEWQIHPEYHVAMNFEDVNYYEYLEDPDGEERWGHVVDVTRQGGLSGGLKWDSVGAVADTTGFVWDDGGGSTNEIYVESIDLVYPVIVINSPTENPVFENVSTATTLEYDGNVAAGQTLTIDCQRQMATLNGVSVLDDITGDWIALRAGANQVVYQTDNNAPPCQVKWAEVVG